MGERPREGLVPTCSSSWTMLRLLFSTAWMSGERPLLMSCARKEGFEHPLALPKQPEARIPTAGSSILFSLGTSSPASRRPHPGPARPKLAHHRVDVRAVLQQEQHRFLALGVHGHVQGGEP